MAFGMVAVGWMVARKKEVKDEMATREGGSE
jgi:hypothetical protein